VDVALADRLLNIDPDVGVVQLVAFDFFAIRLRGFDTAPQPTAVRLDRRVANACDDIRDESSGVDGEEVEIFSSELKVEAVN